MKSKLIRLFAVLLSVLVLALALVVPMSADSFDSSKPLVESDWEYVTVIDYKSFSSLSNIANVVYDGACYVIFEVNGDRYSIRADSFSISADQYSFYVTNSFEGQWPKLTLTVGIENCAVYGLLSESVAIVDRSYSYLTSVSITIYTLRDEFTNLSYDSDIVSISVDEVEPTTNRITSVFTNIMDWITSGLNSVQGVFYANNQLTMLGTLAVIGVAIAVAFLLIGVLQRFLHLRG